MSDREPEQIRCCSCEHLMTVEGGCPTCDRIRCDAPEALFTAREDFELPGVEEVGGA